MPVPARPNRHSEAVPKALSWSEENFFERLPAMGSPFILILDCIQDPHNLGACLRSANAAGVDAVLAPRDKSCGLTDTVIRVSCGGASHTPFVSVTNLARAMQRLQKAGVWLVGTADEATKTIYDQDLTGPIGLVMGNEAEGLRRLTRENCDFLVNIPMTGEVPCLNVSVASGVCLFEARRQRLAAEGR